MDGRVPVVLLARRTPAVHCTYSYTSRVYYDVDVVYMYEYLLPSKIDRSRERLIII